MSGYTRAFAVFTAALLAAACGDVDTADDRTSELPVPEASAAPADTTALPPDDGAVESVAAVLSEWSVTLSQDSVPAGPISFNVRNAGTMAHRFEVEGNGEEWASENLAPAGTVTMSLNLTPGEYKVYCPITGGGESHEARGMTTTLRVY
jgi:plastocyanin